MGKQLIWQDRFNIGVSFIDEEHKKLFSILNKLFEHGKQEEKGRWVCPVSYTHLTLPTTPSV